MGGNGERNQRGIQSVEVGGQLLLALSHRGRPMALKDLAREAGMAPAKAHPYLVSFGKLGLIAQDAVSGRYGLGPLALQLGLISLQQFDPVRLATPRLPELAQALGHTVALAVWGNRGPTIVRIEEPPTAVHVVMRHGTVMSLRGTASGRLFAAYLPRETVRAALAEEHARDAAPHAAARTGATIDAAFRRQLDEVRRHGLSHTVDGAVPGVSALAAPVFDEVGRIVLSLTAIGPSSVFDVRHDGPLAVALRRCADELSQRLGAPADRQAA
ncbi:MAG TPA: IclR family transcriptional regulator [Ideonella sp.]|nr:IclR family transcriptional regulator [Ideonella sp.]